MEEDREFKHSCKFCNKRFPCGRSLGGHMRSHMINNNNSAETTKDGKFGKKKLPSVNNGERVSINNSSLEDHDSWTNNSTQKLVMDTQSDNETAAAAPNRKRRSKRRRTRYMATANSSSFSVADNNNNNGSSSVSEIEQEQSEVAMCLMMLSRDMGPLVCFNSAAQSSDNTSVFSDAGEILKKKKNNKDKFNSELGSNYKQNSSKFECTTCNKIFHSYQALGGHRASHKKIKGCFASKTDHRIETQLIISSPDHPTTAIHHSLAAADYVPKRRHECPICFRVFSSGQALGGHKRSHLVNNVINEGRSDSTIVMEKEKPRPEIPNLLDLNLPASADQEESMKPWWIESSHKHEALVGFHF